MHSPTSVSFLNNLYAARKCKQKIRTTQQSARSALEVACPLTRHQGPHNDARAKEIRPLVEKLVTRGMKDTLANRRVLVGRLGDERAVTKLIKMASAYVDRTGGYLRIVKMGPRKGDASPMALIEFI